MLQVARYLRGGNGLILVAAPLRRHPNSAFAVEGVALSFYFKYLALLTLCSALVRLVII